MALKYPETVDAEQLRQEIRMLYERLAAEPDGEFRFHRGRNYALTLLNYSPDELARVPRVSAKRFSGVGNPHRIGRVRPGETVLDHACGAGLDVIVAAHRVGSSGRVIGVDISARMLDYAWQGAVAAGVDDRVSLFAGAFEDLPVDTASVDVVISNAALNLAPDKYRVLTEISRVLKPGGRLHLADVVVQQAQDDTARASARLWASCVGGALPEPDLRRLLADAGFVAARITERFDCFRGAAAEYDVPRNCAIGAVNVYARKPGL